ncbi:MAG TPA: hypothetical protein VGE67_15045 [Haloferula sp.]
MMPTIAVEIVRFTDEGVPSWVESALQDALGREWRLIDKVPIFTLVNLDASSSYPQPGSIACEIVREWIDEDGRKRCLIDTTLPCGIDSVEGETRFEVFRDQVETSDH